MAGPTERVAIVTGGTGGLGTVIATRLAQSGSTVVIADLDADLAEQRAKDIALATGGRLVGLAVDVTSDSANRALIGEVADRFGRLDQLINNAGRSQRDAFGDIGVEDWQQVMAVNLWGPTSLTQAATPLFKSAGSGRVVNIASRTWLTGGPLAYVSSKAGVVGLTRALAVELGHLNVTVNAVSPSSVATAFIREGRTPDEYERHIAHHRTLTLLPRLATPDDVADAVDFLASDRAAFITGEVLHVSGGAQLAPPP